MLSTRTPPVLISVLAAVLLTVSGCTPDNPAAVAGTTAATRVWSPVQTASARLIVDVGRAMGVPRYGQQIALATAMQESGLRNLPGGPDDSAGLFQQRPSQGWGTYRQVTTPRYAATRFYQALLLVPHWQRRALYDAAQAVQRSCCPLLYRRWARAAADLLEIVNAEPPGGGPDRAGF